MCIIASLKRVHINKYDSVCAYTICVHRLKGSVCVWGRGGGGGANIFKVSTLLSYVADSVVFISYLSVQLLCNALSYACMQTFAVTPQDFSTCQVSSLTSGSKRGQRAEGVNS